MRQPLIGSLNMLIDDPIDRFLFIQLRERFNFLAAKLRLGIYSDLEHRGRRTMVGRAFALI